MPEAVTITDAIDPARAQALLASLGRPRRVNSGDVLPPLAHFAFFWEPVDEAQIGRDGHARPGGLIPDLGLPIRMWAGGRLTFHAPFRAGFAAQKVTTLHEVKEKRGRSGRLGLVTLKHEIRQRHAPVISEMQDIVYREPGPPSGNPPLESGKAHERHALKLREVTLFRYSAITFNGHRIHYDANYCREEGYPGLVVHGAASGNPSCLPCRRASRHAQVILVPRDRPALSRRCRMALPHGRQVLGRRPKQKTLHVGDRDLTKSGTACIPEFLFGRFKSGS